MPTYSSEDFRKEIKRVKRKRRIIAAICIVAALIIALAVAAAIAFKIPSSLHTVTDDGMSPTLSKGQVVYVESVSEPSANEIVVFRSASGDELTRRVVAVEGEWVNVSDSATLVVSTSSLEGSATIDAAGNNISIVSSLQVPENACFVMADSDGNPQEALRQTDNFVAYGQLFGRAVCKVWPPTSIGAVS